MIPLFVMLLSKVTPDAPILFTRCQVSVASFSKRTLKGSDMAVLTMKEILVIPGLQHIAHNVSRFLDAKSLAQCRLVCQSWRNLIDNDRPWLIFQLQHIQNRRKMLGTSSEGRPIVQISIQEAHPEWCNFIQQVSKKLTIPDNSRNCQANVGLFQK